jgi:predicted amidohydrolase YtcJ
MKAAALFLLSAPCLFASDMILIHGQVYTGKAAAPWAEALSVTGTRIEAVGSDAEVSRRKTAQTKVIDLKGRTVIPGIVDIHEHILYGGMAIQGFNFSTPDFNITPDDPDVFIASLKVQAANHPNDRVLYGRASFPLTPDSSAKLELLDRAVPDRYLVIHATHEHALWVNSKVLALAGFTVKPLADPFLEQFIVRDPSGRPTGVVRETAMQTVNKALPPMPIEQRMSVLRDAARFLNSYGITSVAELTGDMDELEALAKLRDRGQLTVRVRVGFAKVAVNHKATPEFFAELEKARSLYRDDFVSANLVKFFADGLGSPLLYEPRDYNALINELDKRGFQIVTHALSIAGAHAVLDGYEELERTNAARDRRLRVEHASSLDPADLARFAKLSIVAGMQPAFCCRNQSYQMGSIQNSGALLTLSSDWPCSWPPDPLAGIQQAMLREQRHNVTLRGPEPGETIFTLPEERLTIEQAVAGYTRNAAWANFTEDRVGTLEAGKEADLAVLSRDIFHTRPEDIGRTQVILTLTGGKVVFERQ